MSRELLIYEPDGRVSPMRLTGQRVAVGRSSAVDLSFPDDTGLSRRHFAFESQGGDEWTVQDLGSKNGTLVNNIPLKARLALKPGDRISAGHLTIVYAPAEAGDSKSETRPGVVVFEGDPGDTTSSSAVTLEGALTNQTMLFERGGARTSAPLEALIQAGRQLSENLPLEELFEVILGLAIQAVNAQRGVVLILENGELVAKAHRGEGFRISTKVRDRVIEEKVSLLVKNTALDDAFKGRMSIVEQRVHTMMAAPLQTGDRIIGLIYVDSPFILREFKDEDLSLLTVMANIAAVRIEHARLAEIEQAERILQRDLTQAAEIQQGILPDQPPQVAGFELAGFNLPCRTVGGDYYGFLTYPDGRVGLALGDVSGKGMPAALMVMAFDARLRVLAEDEDSPEALVSRLNKTTCANCPSNRFITFFYGIADPATGELTFANAGHNPPFLVRASGEVEPLSGGGPVLGMIPFAPYERQSTRLDSGDVLVIYSDGVTEANNISEEEFGEERLAAVLRSHRARPAGAIVNAVMEALGNFTMGAPQGDDITLVVARRV
ncbi:MAG TPA: SpoIIE family protein phosphatase [Bryobacteraceae bacterium]|nr:SpoIIE family protein phosphatase [Bryobacteraceae bacterium]